MLNYLYVVIIVMLCYILYSYIQSYHKIIDELTKIRIKCINNKEENIHVRNFELETKNNKYDTEDINKEKNKENNGLTNFQELSNIDNSKYDTENINQEKKNNGLTNFQELSNIDNDNYNRDENNIQNDIINPLSNNYTDKKFIDNINFNKNEINKIFNDDINNNQEFQREKEIEYWSPFKEKHQEITEGFISSPYKGFNQNLYENLIVNFNTNDNKVI